MNESQPNEPEPLQFDRADFDDTGGREAAPGPPSVQCSLCASAIAEDYYEINGTVTCKTCHDQAVETRTSGSGVGRFLRALAFGSVAGLSGFLVYWGVAAVTEREFSIIAMLVGFLVGTAVKIGSRSRGGWLYQLLAVALTYVAIVASYVPIVLSELAAEPPTGVGTVEVATTETADPAAEAGALSEEDEDPGPDAAETATGDQTAPARNAAPAVAELGAEPPAGTPPAAADPAAPPSGASSPGSPAEAEAAWLDGLLGDLLPEEGEEVGLGAVVLVLAVFFVLLLALPFLAGFENILGLVILGIGLYVAWATNKKEAFETAGPFRIGGGPPGTGATATA